jgi:hypothetical protein
MNLRLAAARTAIFDDPSCDSCPQLDAYGGSGLDPFQIPVSYTFIYDWQLASPGWSAVQTVLLAATIVILVIWSWWLHRVSMCVGGVGLHQPVGAWWAWEGGVCFTSC